MKRTRRHKFLKISVFFLIYSIIHVVTSVQSYDVHKRSNQSEQAKNHVVPSTKKTTTTATSTPTPTTKRPTTKETTTTETTTFSPTTTITPSYTTITTTHETNHNKTSGNETEECTPPAIKQVN